LRSSVEYLGVQVDDALTFGLAGRIGLSDAIELIPLVTGQVSILASDLDIEEIPVEGLLGLKVHPAEGLSVELGLGGGLIAGFGTPTLRGFLGVSYAQPPSIDTDGDGYFDRDDGCRFIPEDMDGFQDEDGCGDPDNDDDSLVDVTDVCPMEAEDFDGWQDSDGCPDPDDDGDGLPDLEDTCPLSAEDFDGFQDEDGCADEDNDGDGVPDAADACPLEPEVVNLFQDEDGCPDVSETMVIHDCQDVTLSQDIAFQARDGSLTGQSRAALDELVELLLARDDIARLAIEAGPGDVPEPQGEAGQGTQQSETVLAYLVGRGAPADRLVTRTPGPMGQELATDGATSAGRNQGVRFLILEQEGCENTTGTE
jgi:large repetitive protein